ncbi:hypothetical protein [Treponema sp. UBA3813]|uniref:hypothetical protein n=1 Tax=Treponema sp. UBA3813 TaxID=1947715 RepID=UPI0025DE8350|nr:hypothetical protein [Treponema sp. UBA3813]
MKKCLSVLIFAFLSFSTFAVSLDDFSLSVEPLFGMKYGQIDEYVFLKKSNFSNDKLSELNWEIQPEWYYGFNIHGGLKQFFVETGLKFGVSGKTGQMMDSDWFNAQTSSMPHGVSSKKAAGHDYKTHYSEHDNNLDYDINFNIKGGYEFRIFEIFGIKPSLSYDYQNIKFTGRNGKGWYGLGRNRKFYDLYEYYAAYDDTANQYSQEFSGRVITYQRELSLFWLGSDFSVDLPLHFSVTAGFFFAPYVYAVSYDCHLTTNIDYADLTKGSFSAFKWNLGATYNITPKHSVSLNAEYLYMRVLRGKDYFKQASSNTYKESSEADGGAGAKYFNLTLSYKFKIL